MTAYSTLTDAEISEQVAVRLGVSLRNRPGYNASLLAETLWADHGYGYRIKPSGAHGIVHVEVGNDSRCWYSTGPFLRAYQIAALKALDAAAPPA